jgi:hypothetical protein
LGTPNRKALKKKTRIENATRDVARMYQATVPHKGKYVVENWEEELKVERESKDKNKIAQEVDWIIDMGTTRTRETLYQKTLEMVWHTKMLIGKVKENQEETRKEDQREMKTMLEDIKCRVSGLETIVKLMVEIEKNHQRKQERHWQHSSTCT